MDDERAQRYDKDRTKKGATKSVRIGKVFYFIFLYTTLLLTPILHRHILQVLSIIPVKMCYLSSVRPFVRPSASSAQKKKVLQVHIIHKIEKTTDVVL